jgi:hypothetical protein
VILLVAKEGPCSTTEERPSKTAVVTGAIRIGWMLGWLATIVWSLLVWLAAVAAEYDYQLLSKQNIQLLSKNIDDIYSRKKKRQYVLVILRVIMTLSLVGIVGLILAIIGRSRGAVGWLRWLRTVKWLRAIKGLRLRRMW